MGCCGRRVASHAGELQANTGYTTKPILKTKPNNNNKELKKKSRYFTHAQIVEENKIFNTTPYWQYGCILSTEETEHSTQKTKATTQGYNQGSDLHRSGSAMEKGMSSRNVFGMGRKVS